MKTAKKEQEFISKQNSAQSGRSMTVSEGSSIQYASQSIVHIFQVYNNLIVWSLISILLCHTITCNGKSAKWTFRKTQRNQRNQKKAICCMVEKPPMLPFFLENQHLPFSLSLRDDGSMCLQVQFHFLSCHNHSSHVQDCTHRCDPFLGFLNPVWFVLTEREKSNVSQNGLPFFLCKPRLGCLW